MAKERALNVFDVLKKIDKGDYELYDSVSDEERKELDAFVGFPALRWMSAAENDQQHALCLEMIDEIANPGYFELGKHKKLQTMLLTVAGARTWVKHIWISGPKSSKKGKIYEVLRQAYVHIKDDECDLWLEINGTEGVLELAKRLGYQKDDMKKLAEEISKK